MRIGYEASDSLGQPDYLSARSGVARAAYRDIGPDIAVPGGRAGCPGPGHRPAADHAFAQEIVTQNMIAT